MKPEDEALIVYMIRVVFMPSDPDTSVTFLPISNDAIVRWKSPQSQRVFEWKVTVARDCYPGVIKFKIQRGEGLVIEVLHIAPTNTWQVELVEFAPNRTSPTIDPYLLDIVPLLKAGTTTKIVNASSSRGHNGMSRTLLDIFTGSPGIYHQVVGDNGYSAPILELASHFRDMPNENKLRVKRQRFDEAPKYSAEDQLRNMKSRLAKLREKSLTAATREVLDFMIAARTHYEMSEFLGAHAIRHSANRHLVVSEKSPTILRSS